LDKALLKYYIEKNGDTMKTLAGVLGIHPNTLSRKVNGADEFTQSEINVIVARYNLSPENTMKIFFNDHKVAELDTEEVI